LKRHAPLAHHWPSRNFDAKLTNVPDNSKTNGAANKHPLLVKSLQKLVGGFQREWDY
jgi:hypothetical protein